MDEETEIDALRKHIHQMPASQMQFLHALNLLHGDDHYDKLWPDFQRLVEDLLDYCTHELDTLRQHHVRALQMNREPFTEIP